MTSLNHGITHLLPDSDHYLLSLVVACVDHAVHLGTFVHVISQHRLCLHHFLWHFLTLVGLLSVGYQFVQLQLYNILDTVLLNWQKDYNST